MNTILSPRLLANLFIAIDGVIANKLRSLLTALGIIFGVAAVIAMLAIGNGAQQEILNQIKLVGVNNIVIKPIIEQKEEKIEEKVGKKLISIRAYIVNKSMFANSTSTYGYNKTYYFIQVTLYRIGSFTTEYN